jgi:Zn-dependent peptidase ImmA (M78 family)
MELPFKAGNQYIIVPEDTILLDERLESKSELHRRRFTIAHECAHQILARMEEDISRVYSFRDLQSAEDWSEWQANVLAAALLIPRQELMKELNTGRRPFKPTIYGKRFNAMDYGGVKSLARKFCVSLSAMIIRLKEIDAIIMKDASEYNDPLEILCG